MSILRHFSVSTLPEGLFPVVLPLNILRPLLSFSFFILTTCPAHLNVPDGSLQQNSLPEVRTF